MDYCRSWIFNLCMIVILVSMSGCVNQKSSNEPSLVDPSASITLTESLEKEGDSEEVIHIISSTWEPYEYEENGIAKGIGLDVTIEAFKRMGYGVTVEFVPFNRALDMIQRGEADVLTDVNITADREQIGIFSKESIALSYTSLFVKIDSPIQFDGNIFSLKQYTFGINRGYTHGKEFDDAATDKLLKVEEAENMEQNLKKLLNNRIDIFIDNKLAVWIAAKELGCEEQIKVLEPEYRKAELRNLFSKAENRAHVVELFDQKVIEIKEDGTFQKIYDLYTQ